MSKELTEQWLNGTLPAGCYYVLSTEDDTPVACDIDTVCDFMIRDIIAPVPDYFDCKRLMNDSIELDKAKIKIYELVSKTDELVQKIHILNEQNTKQYNELCEEIKKNNILEKKLEIATKALKFYTLEDSYVSCFGNPVNPNPMVARKALKDIKEVK